MHKRKIISKKTNQGSALIFALGMLMVFATLGAFYLREMTLEMDTANYDLAKTRARVAAEAGINAGIAEISQAVLAGKAWDVVGRTREYEIPLYRQIRSASRLELAKDDRRTALAKVVVSDESGKININHTPAVILARALGVSEEKAKNIRATLPRGNAELDAKNKRRWIAELDELYERGLMTQEELAKVDRSLVSTHTVLNHEDPGRYLNLNTAPVGVLAILFNISQEEAERVAAQRPFGDFSAVKAAVGKDPATYNFAINKDDPDMLPSAFRLESRCFRLKCDAYEANVFQGRESRRVSAYAEAMISFADDGTWKTVAWSGRRAVEDIY